MFSIIIEIDREQAKTELHNLKAMLKLIKDPNLGASISIGQLSGGVSVNKKLKKIIKYEIKQIKRFLKGKSNTWE